ncbi:hypothetical protein EC849_102443 [Pseudomonas putida]|nr:hypothetical protein EC849_102443 [Pseudomonas putida]
MHFWMQACGAGVCLCGVHAGPLAQPGPIVRADAVAANARVLAVFRSVAAAGRAKWHGDRLVRVWPVVLAINFGWVLSLSYYMALITTNDPTGKLTRLVSITLMGGCSGDAGTDCHAGGGLQPAADFPVGYRGVGDCLCGYLPWGRSQGDVQQGCLLNIPLVAAIAGPGFSPRQSAPPSLLRRG